MMSALSYAVSSYDAWQVIGHPTFRGMVPSLAGSRKLFFGLLREVADMTGQHFKSLYFVGREETGSLGRPHLHFLLGNLRAPVTTALLWRIHDTWEHLGGGRSVIDIFDRALNGPTYVTKCLSGEHEYEVRRFGLEFQDVILGESWVEHMSRVGGSSCGVQLDRGDQTADHGVQHAAKLRSPAQAFPQKYARALVALGGKSATREKSSGDSQSSVTTVLV